jgi:predicted MFS family arabinose efflux permease
MVMTALLLTIEATYHISHAQSGLLMTSYFYPYALIQIPIGALSDRWSKKRFSCLALVGSSLASLAFPLAQSLGQMIILRAIAGFSAGLWYAPSLSLLTQSVSDGHRGKAMGIALSGTSASDVIIFLTVGMLGVESFGWINYFLIFAIPGFVCALVTWLFVIETGEKTRNSRKGGEGSGKIGGSLRNPTVLRIIAFYVVFSLALWSLRSFLPTYLVQARELSTPNASLLMMAYAVAAVFASPLAGYLVDRLGYGRPTLIAFVVMSAGILAIPVTPMGAPLATTLFIWGLVASWPITALSVLLTRLVPARMRGTFFGIQNSCTFFGAATGPLLLGYAADIGGFGAFFALALVLSIISAIAVFPILRVEMTSRSRQAMAENDTGT